MIVGDESREIDVGFLGWLDDFLRFIVVGFARARRVATAVEIIVVNLVVVVIVVVFY